MALIPYVPSLRVLALDKFVNYVKDLAVQFFTIPKDMDSKRRYIKHTCRRLQLLIQTNVVSDMADEITARLLKCVDVNCGHCSEWREEVMSEILPAILHPHVMRLEFFVDTSHPTQITDFRVLTFDDICCFVSGLNYLKVMKISSDSVWHRVLESDVHIPESLEQLSFRSCRNEILEIFSKFCIRLKRLRFVDFHGGVTDESVPFIQTFRQLEELIMICETISEEGIIQILDSLAQSTSGPPLLKSFGCYSPADSHIRLLVQKYPNLISLSLMSVRYCDLWPLKELKHLSKLTLSSFHFSQAGKLIHALGCQLKYLELSYMYGIDLELISDSCCVLECLHLIFSESEDVPVPNYSKSDPPKMPSVQCLHIRSSSIELIKYILFQTVNVRSLYFMNTVDRDWLCQFFLVHEKFKQLEHIYYENFSECVAIRFHDDRAVISETDQDGKVSFSSANTGNVQTK